jgi:hypothetical protein
MNLLRLCAAGFMFALLGCTTLSTNPPSPSADITPTTEMVAPTPTEFNHASESIVSDPTPTILPPNTYGVVDASTLTKKVIFGYQGWYLCPDDGSLVDDWFHWFSGPRPDVDFWPDTSELTEGELCPTALQDTQGNPLFAYSAYNPLTVLRHFKWMAEYGIDGVELQRFASELYDPVMKDARDQVLANVQAAAETYGRVFYIQYDAVDSSTLDMIKQDWQALVDNQKVTDSPQYQHHQGLPVVGLFGIGLPNRPITPQEALDLIRFFQDPPEPRYRARVLGGVPFFWRTLDRDSMSDPVWAQVYRALDIINPWSVGRIIDKSSADLNLIKVIKPDLEETRALGIEYMPVIYPGFSWSNLYPGDPYNKFPRNGGSFYWNQAYNLVSAGVEMIYVAMFDELDEGTSMFKMVETAEELPEGEVFVPLNIDGFDLPSDWYLRLGGQTGAMLRGEIPLSPEVPGLQALSTEDQLLLHMEYTSGADWNNLEVLNPEIVRSLEIVSTEGDFTSSGATSRTVNMTQPLENAQAGMKITVWVDIRIKASAGADALELRLTKGSLNTAELRFYAVVNGDEITIREVNHSLTANDNSGQNPLEFLIPVGDLSPETTAR